MCVCTWLHCYPPSSNPSGKPRPHTQCACTMTTNSLQLTYQTTALSVFVLLVVSTTRLLITHASQLWMLMELKLSPGWHMSFSPTPDCTNEHVCVCALPGQDCATNGQIAFHILVHLCSGHNSSSTTAASLAAASTPSSSPATLIDGCIQSHNDRHLHLVEHINTPC